ncbi:MULTISPECIES: hypothetical protein [Pseudoalteromonas]|uniref:Uncharacterized protein n=1 Tax=Pseudoalteromonas maricaloris TaxID=184924 RepID=A0A8I2H5G6_9GAMM|nr:MULTISPECIES: hypothetical protein [Pseudoalteromonas]KID36747.1 hypothetical protein QT15_09650 [Pseudoalteromonas flavipulchra NCIMB 2033 = ATCC BAA-314]MBD0782368.1 hypothetical protein [Pseudoalteromonas flavipulchra]MBE0374020.1 hypothetical protein [Pseudoalteromonas flavipulchra NCIMB 2033 = ATCC BAA-314]NLR22307.1 hypothetical protein [Pseudoalteromonas maricaloris]RZG17378.1 hypothetical protein EXT47_02660 [Pseudoalteromonas sp. CO342X]
MCNLLLIAHNSFEILDLVKQAYEINSEKLGGSDLEKQKNMTIIERGARAEYLFWAGRNLVAALLTTCIYALSIYIIFEIILVQAGSVIEMAGWSDLTELFRLNGKL